MGIALSWSRLSDYNQCPLKFKLKYLSKDPSFKEDESASPHLVRGNNVHKALENYVVQKSTDLEIKITSLPEVETTKPFVDRLFDTYSTVLPEAQIAIDNDWNKVEWFSRDAKFRAIFDCIAISKNRVSIIDWKTGKMRDYDGGSSGFGQLHLSAAIGFHLWPDVETIDSTYVYVDHKQTMPKTFNREDAPKLRAHFDSEYDKVNADSEFKPKINEFCKWCPATRAKCPYSRKL